MCRFGSYIDAVAEMGRDLFLDSLVAGGRDIQPALPRGWQDAISTDRALHVGEVSSYSWPMERELEPDAGRTPKLASLAGETRGAPGSHRGNGLGDLASLSPPGRGGDKTVSLRTRGVSTPVVTDVATDLRERGAVL